MLNNYSFKTDALLAFILTFVFFFSLQVTAQSINMTNGENSSTCGGTFYDPAGTANYSYNSNTTTHTICSSTPGEFPRVEFTSFNLWTNSCVLRSYDVLNVYDGSNTSSPLIASYEQTQGLGQVVIGSSGCLTFEFVMESGTFLCASNSGAPGWAATISCIDELPPSGDNCFDAVPFCSDQNYVFQNSTTGSAPDGPDYGCLGSQPRPIWYYMKIADSGPMQLHLAQQSSGGSGIDIDFAMWGPFTDLPTGCNQVMGGNLAPLQCSFSASATETIGLGMSGGTSSGASTPPNAQAGEYYILLLTNYSGSAGTITLNQTGGTGATDCSILIPCSIDNFTANVSACTNDLYSVTGTIEVTDAPTTGNLIVVDCNGNQTIVASAPFNASSYNYTLNNSNANGNACSVEVYFSDATSCSQTITYTAPACPVGCNLDHLDVLIGACNASNTFEITGTVEFSNPPASGQLLIEDCNGNSATFNAPFTSPQNFTISDIDADGAACDITVTFTADPACTIDISYTNTQDCACNAEIGTFTVTTDGTQNGNDITLCEGQEFTFLANGDYTPPDIASNSTVSYDPGVWWIVYSCPPTFTSGVQINDDPCLVTFLNGASISDLNDFGFINSFPPGTFTNNTVYFAPITMYNITDGYYSSTNSGTYCYDMGPAISVQYLPEIITNKTSDCQAGTVSVTVSGGAPGVNGSNFTASNLIPTSASFNNSTVGNNGTVVVSGLQDGDVYSFDIKDEFNCAVTISGTFIGVSTSDFSYANSEYCEDESNPSPIITGASGGVFTSTPAGLSINGSTGIVNLGSSAPGSYTISYTSPGAPCNSTSSFNITVNSVPDFTVSHTDPTCGNNDGSITLSGLNPSTSFDLNYSLNGTSTGVQSHTTNGSGGILIANLGQGNYSNFQITSAAGCSLTLTVTEQLIEPNAPSVIAPNDVDICLGEDVTLTATNPGGATISWDNGMNDGVTFTPTAAGTTIYTVTATIASCSATDQVVVNVHGLPTIDAGLDVSICNGENITLTGSGAGTGGTYSWDHSVANGVAFTPNTTETYHVIGTDVNGCVNADDVLITVNPVPSFTVSHTDPTCGNTDGSITLSGLDLSTSFDVNYALNGISLINVQSFNTNAGGEIVIPNLGQGSYSNFELISALGCSRIVSATEQLIEPNVPTVTAPNNVDICLGEDVTLTATHSSGATISWNNGMNDGVTFTPTAAGSTTYNVTATLDNCSASDQVNVIVHSLPTINAGSDKSICEGKKVTLTGSGAGAGGTYSWNHNVANGVAFTPSTTETYQVIGTDVNGCVSTDDVTIIVNDNPVPEFEGDRLKGCEPLLVNFTNTTGLTGVTCHWDFGDGNTSSLCNGVINNYTTNGLYDVTLTLVDVNGCTGATTNHNYIEVVPRPEASFEADPMVTGISSAEVNFTNTTINGTDFIWNFGDGSPIKNTFDAFHTFPHDKGGDYVVTLIASNGPDCNDTVRLLIKVEDELIYYIPNTFTPDGDSYNETFKPIFTSGFDPLEYNLKIFNRWGEILFESNNSEYGWNGAYGVGSAKIVKEGVYIWKIEFKKEINDEHVSIVGHVNLLR